MSSDGQDDDGTEVRECVCGREFTVNVKYARPWTVCPACMMGDCHFPAKRIQS